MLQIFLDSSVSQLFFKIIDNVHKNLKREQLIITLTDVTRLNFFEVAHDAAFFNLLVVFVGGTRYEV